MRNKCCGNRYNRVVTPKPQIHNPRVLRALAHPARSRILAELSATGRMRAADIARDLDIPANQASFHLRQLAKYGLVEEDPAAARDKRDRVWKLSAESDYVIELGEVENPAQVTDILKRKLSSSH